MQVFKCKMCGGTIEFEPKASIGVCDSCGTRQTLPRLDDDKKANLYDRADHFRRNNDYDKAMSIYEQILNEDSTDAEAYWSLVLCRYGIEYVEEPSSHKRIPTVNRAQFTSIYMDEDYKSALQYADGEQREIYAQEAKAIDDIQKGILAISSKEEPFDVFICYKETDNNGRRTQDSVLANELYHQLTQEGFKTFFSRITLEDKLGTAYEPYIFAALSSAKVMVVLGTRPEYFNAVWVKNEWSRYLALVRQSGGKKMLIPAYKDMDPYDLPDEFSNLQAQDMSKLGFMQDLIRGIGKILNKNQKNQTANPTRSNTETVVDVKNLLVLARNALDMANIEEALNYANSALTRDSTCSDAWLIRMDIVAAQIREQPSDEIRLKELNHCGKNAIKYAQKKNTEKLTEYIVDVYENCLKGYVEKLSAILRETKTAFNAYWGQVQYNRLKADIVLVKSTFAQFAEVCKEIYDTPNSKETVLPLYKALELRLTVSQQRMNQWRAELRDEQQQITDAMNQSFQTAKRQLARVYPDINSMTERITLPTLPAQKPSRGMVKSFAYGAFFISFFGIFCIPLGFVAKSAAFFIVLGVVCAISIPLMIRGNRQYKQNVEKYNETMRQIEGFNRKLNDL